jgi:23S rRNA (cytosine1962-C5)-methyltransferase
LARKSSSAKATKFATVAASYTAQMHALLDAIITADIDPNSLEAKRVFHGRGGLYAGCEHLSLDIYPPVWVLTSFQPLSDHDLARVDAAIHARCAVLGLAEVNWVYQHRDTGRAETRLMKGVVPDPHVIAEAGCRYLVHVLRGQNHGLFLDMAAGRAWLHDRISAKPGARVLNLFAYTCAFSVVAKRAGAGDVINLDMSESALRIGQQNHQLNDVAHGARFMAHDLFKSWGKVKRFAPYDVIIVDPPSHQKGSFVATKDYARLLRHLDDLCDNGSDVLLCLNAPELSDGYLKTVVAAHAPHLQFVARVPNPASFADCSDERSLKVLHYTCRFGDADG